MKKIEHFVFGIFIICFVLICEIFFSLKAAEIKYKDASDIEKELVQKVGKEIYAIPKFDIKPLNELIPDKERKLIDDRKRNKPKPSPEPVSFLNLFISNVFAMGPKPQPAPSPSLKPISQSVDLRKFDSPVKSQWDGTCTAFGLAASMENKYIQRDNKVIDISERDLWSYYHVYSVAPALQAAYTWPINSESYWPQSSEKPLQPSTSKYMITSYKPLGDDFEAVKTALRNNSPVYTAFLVPQDLQCGRSVIRDDSALTNGGHAFEVVGFNKDYLIAKNSWGAECHDHGYFYFSKNYCERDGVYCLFYSIDKVL